MIAYILRKIVLPKKIPKNDAPLLNEFTSISVHLDESEAMKIYNLNEIELDPSCILHIILWLIIYSIVYSSQYLYTSSILHHALHSRDHTDNIGYKFYLRI